MAGGISIGVPLGDTPVDFIDLNPYLLAIELVLDALEWLGIIPDPLQELMSLFTGRPRDAATSQVVQFLGTKKNAAARLYGIVLGRLLSDDNVVLSSSSPADQALLSQAYMQFVGSLQAQGLTLQAARNLADLSIGLPGQQGTLHSPILGAPAPANFHIVGPSAIATIYQNGIAAGTAKGLTGDKLSTFATRYTFQHAATKDLLKAQVIPQPPLSYPVTNPPPNWPQNDSTGTTTNPPPSTQSCKPGYTLGPDGITCWIDDTIPTSGQICPSGYQYDPDTELCVYTPPPQPIGPGSPPNPTGPGGGGQNPTIPPPPAPVTNGDELTDCCNATATYLYYIATFIESLGMQGSTGGGNNAQCCANITAQLQAIASGIQAIPGAIPAPSPSTPTDLTAVTAALVTIGTSLGEINASIYAGDAELASAIANVGNAIANAPPTDVAGIVKELAAIVVQLDPKQGVLDYLLAQGFISGADLQAIGGADWGDTIVTVFRTWGWNALTWVAGWVGITYSGGTWSLNGLGEGIANIISESVGSALTAGAAPLLPEITGLVDGVAGVLKPVGATSLGNIGVNPDLVLAKTLAPALILNGVALVGSYLGWEIGESLEKYVDWAATLVGLEELKDVMIGSLFRNGIVKVTDMQTKAIFRQEMPSTETMFKWSAAGWLTAARATALAPYNGTPAELIPVIQNAAYTNLPERLLVRLFDSPTFSQSDLQRIFTEHGMRPQDITDYLNALPYIATQPQRTALVSTLESSFAEGQLSIGDLITAVDNAQQNTDYLSLIETRVQVELLTKNVKALAASYQNMVHAGAIDIPTYSSVLTGIGLQPNLVNNLVAIAENWLTATLQRQAVAAEKQLQRATVNEERKAALQSFKSGATDAAGLAASLLLTGLSAVQAAAWVDVATLQQGGSTRLVYGLRVLPAQADFIRSQVNALIDQRKKNLITDDVLKAQLTQLKIPANWQNSILAAADAGIDVTGSPVLVKVLTA